MSDTTDQLEEVRQRYLQYVRNNCRWLDFRGLILLSENLVLPLPDIYVHLYVMVTRSDEVFKHLALRARVRYLAETALIEKHNGKTKTAVSDQDIDVGMQFELADEMRRLAVTFYPKRMDAARMLEKQARLVILGDPGSGKTTFLRYLALAFAEGQAVVKERLGLDLQEAWLPILIQISDYAEACRTEPGLSLAEYLPRYFAKRQLDLPELPAYFGQELAAGRCLVLLDGLDTVLDNIERLEVARRVNDFVNSYSSNCYVITSRIEGYPQAPLGEEYLHCTVGDLEMQEIERFARRWSLAREIQVADTPERRALAERQASRLLEDIRTTLSLRRLAGNPLLLTIIALAHRRERLPRYRIELYTECVRTLIERWNQVHNLNQPQASHLIDAVEAIRILAPLALWMHDKIRSSIVNGEELEAELRSMLVNRGLPEQEAAESAHTFLDMERNQIGLLVERGVNVFGFSHLTFQEYFAARAVASSRGKIVDKLRLNLHDPRWREVILLTISQIGIVEIKEELVTLLVQEIAESNSPLEGILHRDLLLAGRCLADDVGVAYQERKELLERLLGLWHTAHFDGLRREIAGVLVAMRGTFCESQVVEALLADLDSDNVELCEAAAETLGRMGMTSDRVLDKLVDILRADKRPQVRAHAALALSHLNVPPQGVVYALDEALRRESGHEVRWRIAEALANIGQANDQAIDLLVSALNNEDGNVRGSAAAALASLKDPPDRLVDILLKALRDARADVRTNAADTLGRLGQSTERAVAGLVNMLRDREENARISATLALGQVGNTSPGVIQGLIARLADDSRPVRKNAAAALGKLAIRSQEVISALQEAQFDKDKGVGAAEALGRAGKADLEIAGVVEQQLGAGNWQDRIRAVEALVSLDKKGQASARVIETLAAVLTEERDMQNWNVLAGTAIALSEVAKRGDAALSQVVALLNERTGWLVRIAAAEALGLAGKPTQEVIGALLHTLEKDEYDHARGNAAAALGALGVSNDHIIDLLTEGLHDYHGYVRLAAAEALARLGARGRPKVLDGLCELLDDTYYSHYHGKHVRDVAFDALWELAPYSSTELPH